MTCSVLPVAAPLHGPDVVTSTVCELSAALAAAGGRLVDDIAAADANQPLVVLVVTGGTEQLILSAAAERQLTAPGEPLLLLTHPGNNSLAAALEALARLQRDGGRGRIVTVDERTGDGAALADAVHDLAVWHALRTARIGLVGQPSDWLVASIPDRDALHRRWGVTLVDVSLDEALARYSAAVASHLDAPAAVPVRVGARSTAHTPDAEEMRAAATFLPILRDAARENHLDAVTVRCFDLVLQAHTSGCLALSSLNDEGVIAGCEGDVASTVALLWMRHLTGLVGWMANPAMADPETGLIELAHCTVPLSLVSGYELDTHFESDLGVGISGDLPSGPVTVLRLGGLELEQLWCVDGKALATPRRSGRCRTQLDVRVDPDSVAALLDRPLGNHLVVIAGHHADAVRRWFRTTIATS